MLPDRVSNPGPLTSESGALPIALRGLARTRLRWFLHEHITAHNFFCQKLEPSWSSEVDKFSG